MIEKQFFSVLFYLEMALLLIYGVSEVVGYLFVLVATKFKKQVEQENDTDAQQDTAKIRDGATALLDAFKTVGSIAGAVALAVFVGSLALVGYMVYKRIVNAQ